MSSIEDEVRKVVRNYIVHEIGPGEDSSTLTDATPLITSGILDSIAVVRLASELEARFGVELQSRDLTTQHFDTIQLLCNMVARKSRHEK